MSQKSWEALVPAFVLEASRGLRELALPIEPGDRIKAQIARAARRAGFTYWRAFDLWYGKARCVQAAEIEAIREARRSRARERSDELACLASDFETLAERMSALAAGPAGSEAERARLLADRVRRLAAGE